MQTICETRSAIFSHFQNGLISQKFVDKLTEMGQKVSKSTVLRDIKEFKMELEEHVKPAKRLGTQSKSRDQTSALIKKVKNLIDRPDLWTIRGIARKLGAIIKMGWKTILDQLKGEL